MLRTHSHNVGDSEDALTKILRRDFGANCCVNIRTFPQLWGEGRDAKRLAEEPPTASGRDRTCHNLEVINAHHMIVNTLSCMNVCATIPELSPRLQRHNITASAVAMRQAELVRASQVSMMTLGIDFIFAHGMDVAGPKQKKHKPSLTPTRRSRMLTCQKDSGGISN